MVVLGLAVDAINVIPDQDATIEMIAHVLVLPDQGSFAYAKLNDAATGAVSGRKEDFVAGNDGIGCIHIVARFPGMPPQFFTVFDVDPDKVFGCKNGHGPLIAHGQRDGRAVAGGVFACGPQHFPVGLVQRQAG